MVKTKIVRCYSCGRRNRLQAKSQKTGHFRCASCGEEVGFSTSKFYISTELSHFIKNNVILIGLPILAAYFYLSLDHGQSITGFLFLFFFTVASICYHELFHAIMSLWGGDFSVWQRGYLRLSPKKYFEFTHALLLPIVFLLFFGVFFPGAAVFINLHLLKNRFFWFCTYLAGVVANSIILLLILMILNNELFTVNHELVPLLHAAAYIQLWIIVVNLLPLPGLDGWGVLSAFLPSKFIKLGNFLFIPSILGFLALLFLGKLDDYFEPFYSFSEFIGIDFDLAYQGLKYIRIFDPSVLFSHLV